MENYWVALLAVAALALTGTFPIAWGFRARAVKRWLTALDAYAERELVRERREKPVKRGQPFSTAFGASGKVRASPVPHGQPLNKGKLP